MNHKRTVAITFSAAAVVVGLAVAQLLPLSASLSAQELKSKYGVQIVPEFNEKGELIRPKGFREHWTYLGSPFTPHSLNNGQAGFPEFHNVYVQPEALAAYRITGKWPEGTMFLKELQLRDNQKGEEEDGSRYEPSGRGFFPGPVNGMDVALKDSSRFAETNNWGFFNFGHHAPPYAPTAMQAPKEECAQCHIDNAHEDMIYVNMYKPLITPLPE